MESFATANWIVAIATIVIAGFAVSNFVLVLRIKIKDDESKQVANDLIRALIASNLVQESKGQASIINTFNALYKDLIEGKLPKRE